MYNENHPDYNNYNDYNENRILDSCPERHPFGPNRPADIAGVQPVHVKPKDSMRKGGKDNMSFTGIMHCRDGLLAFGDSKSTVTLQDGRMVHQQGRDVQKVFKGDGYLLTTFGCNTSPSTIDGTLESWINHHMNETETYYDLLDMMSYVITDASRQYHFFIGAKDRNGFFVQEALVSQHRVIFNARLHGSDEYLRNYNEYYAVWFDTSIKPVIMMMTCDEMQAYLEDILTERIRKMDMELEYDSVGLPLQIETIRV